MSETTYFIENAKSGRSSCKKCKVKIGKDEIRLGVSAPGPGDYNMQSWYHPKCFTLPRKLAKEGIDAASFVSDLLEDNTEDRILDKDSEQIIKDIESKASAKPKSDAEASGAAKSIKRVKENLEKIKTEAIKGEDDDDYDDDDIKPKKKKAKKGKKNSITEDDRAKAEILAIYEGQNNNELKDVLRWNRQMVGGNKDALLSRVIDGHLNGRLGRCPTCRNGRVKLSEEDGGATAYCNGFFDEDHQVRVSCFYKCDVKEAPRLHPWYSTEPTEEQKAEIEAQDEAAKTGGAISEEQNEAVKEDTAKLTKLVQGIDWDLSTGAGIKRAANDMLNACKRHIALPSDEKKARMEIGRILVANKSLSAKETLTEIISRFGLTKAKKDAKKRLHEAHTSLCKHSANVSVMEAFMEMAELAFKEGDAFRGAAYRKVGEAIKEIDYEINEDNAKGLGKGKTKVANIGKNSAEKIFEFVTTGSIEKLEEMKAGSL